MWVWVITGWIPALLAFFDTTDILRAGGVWNWDSNGLMAICMISFTAATIILNFIFYGPIVNWHDA